jgi:ribosomal protein S12 methylthiotransferase accessory factor
LKILWIEARIIDSKARIWVPFECVHTDASLPEPQGSGCFNSTSNGLAAGNNLLEALSHGLCEAIERDATTLWHLTSLEKQRLTRIRLSTIDDSLCLSLLERFSQAGLGTIIWDATSDVGVPSFTCTLFELHQGEAVAFYTSNGAGCHPTKAIALARALTEAAQSRLTLISGSRDDLTRGMYVSRPDVRKAFSFLTDEFHQEATRSFQDVISQENASIEEDISWIIRRLHDIGIEKIVSVNLTKSEIGVPVARVIVPGLETSDEIADYSPGRRARERLCKE